MGRGGGSRGGGGSFGGSRGGGGHSSRSSGISRGSSGSSRSSFSSGRSSSSSGYSSRSSSSSSSYRPTSSSYRPTSNRSYSSSGGSSGVSRNSGCAPKAFGIIFIVVLVIVLVIVLSKCSGGGNTNPGGNTAIIPSTIEREALPKGSANETDYYTDEAGWINNPVTLESGLKYFYNKTGVQPYVYITDDIDGLYSPDMDDMQVFSERKYDELFTDEAHVILVFYERNSGEYMTWYTTGTQAKSVVDAEAGEILLEYIDRYYYENMSDEEFFSKAFKDTADRIMKITRSPWIIVLIVFGTIIILTVLFLWWRNAKKQKNLEAKQTEEMLSKPLEKFGDKEAQVLGKKYDDDPST